MEVYEFNKVFSTRFSEITDVLDCKTTKTPASQLRSQFAYHIEVQIEPAGWQALWKISRVVCEELKIKYPTVVFGMVQDIQFKELKAIFNVIAVEDDNIHIPETHEVPLEELYPTKIQENSAINSERTAECIDKLRFFYTNIWMPWDNTESDDDQDWEEKYLLPRLQFYYDLKSKKIERSLSAHILTLLSEARYIQERRHYLEMGLSDDEENKSDDHLVKDLMVLHLRMNMIKNEIEILQNPEMRNVYKELIFKKAKKKLETKNNVYLVWKRGNLDEQISYLELAKNLIGSKKMTQMCSSLQEALNNCNASDTIFIPKGRHTVKFLESLNNKGSIKSVENSDLKIITKIDPEMHAIILSDDDDSILFACDGDFLIENIILDCRNIRTGILIRQGNVIFRNCVLYGDENSSTKQGIIISGKAELTLENCLIKNFSVGISLQNEGKANLSDSIISNCINGIEIKDDCNIELNRSKVVESQFYGIVFETKTQIKQADEKVILDKLTDLKNYKEFSVEETNEFSKNKLGNIAIYNKKFVDFCSNFSVINDFNDIEIVGENDCSMNSSSDFKGFDDTACDVIVIEDSILEEY